MAKRIFINALNSRTGGGKTILLNILEQIPKQKDNNKVFILVPNAPEFAAIQQNNLTLFKIPRPLQSEFLLPFTYLVVIPLILSYLKIDVIFNLADLVIRTKLKQVYLFDWPYAIYPDSTVWKKLALLEYIKRKIKLYFIKRHLNVPVCVIAQSTAMRDRLKDLYKISNIEVIPNPAWFMNTTKSPLPHILPIGTRLLYLTGYYPHKNIEILLDVAQLIEEKELKYRIILTLDPKRIDSKPVLDEIKSRNLSHIIVNIGQVRPEDVFSLYNEVDALIMPTLLETYGLPYIESMSQNKTIFTSDLDFAHSVCQDAAFYFNPLDAHSILTTISHAFANPTLIEKKLQIGKKIAGTLPNPEQLVKEYFRIINRY
ncbi:glycosyltransferase [Bdellovibrio bacteriovorus]|uniref:glycosyltransferase n=1 Tax=Bdellovibrio bacteriovorus TaxID=959 RepID=UPI003A8083CF